MATSAITPTPHSPAQLRAEVARVVNLGALFTFPLFVLTVFALPSSGAALVALAALALGFLAFLGGAVYVARLSVLRPDHGPAAYLLAVLDRDVTRDELPDGAARLALARAIDAGEIDALYCPMGARTHNVCLASLPADVDPRITIAEWVARWQAQTAAQIEGGR